MSSRQQEKERRREERQARERAEAAAAARRRRLQFAFGGLLAVAAVAGVVVVAAVGFGGNGSGDPKSPPDEPSVQLPQQQIGNLREAARAAGCELQNPEVQGAQHEDKDFAASDYRTNPPNSGNHNPVWYEDGIYDPGTTPRLGELVHTLEHGRINVQYKPGTPAATVNQLEAVLAEQNEGYHMLLYENTTGMDFQVAASAWGHVLGCPEMNDQVIDALRTFTTRYVDRGPEQVP